MRFSYFLVLYSLIITVIVVRNLWQQRLASEVISRDSQLSITPTIYIITATYPRYVQRAELTRLCNTFKNLHKVHWIVVDDAKSNSNSTDLLLSNCRVSYTYLSAETPTYEKPQPNEPYWFRPKGVHQRNAGLQWLRRNLVLGRDWGVLYIADDDNAYSLEIFDQLRYTKTVSTWPVGFAGELPWEGCVTSAENRNKITQMWTAYNTERPFPIDMAGFAVYMDLILSNPNARFDYNRPRGMQESQFILGLGLKHWSQLEPLADGCQKILVWHTRTADPLLSTWHRLQSQGVAQPPMSDPV